MAESAPAPTPKKRGMIELNDEVMREAKKSLKEKGTDKGIDNRARQLSTPEDR
jgi:hypothetical protein